MAQIAYNVALVSTNDLVAAVVRAGGDGRHEYAAKLLPQQNNVETPN